MEKDYSINTKLRCGICGDGDSFECNENKSYVKCTRCGKEYFGGYDEIVEFNKALIDTEQEEMEQKFHTDVKGDFNKMFKDAFKGNKHIKFK